MKLISRNFSKLLIGQAVSTFGNNLFSLALPWFVYSLTQSKTDLSIVGIAQTLPMLTGLFTGVWVDRWRKRVTMLSADSGRFFIALLLAGITAYHMMGKSHTSLIALLPVVILVLFLGCLGAFFNPAAGAFLPMIVDTKDIAKANGLSQSVNATSQLAGTLSGGALLAAFSAPVLFAGDAMTFLVSALSLLLIRVTEPRTQAPSATDAETNHCVTDSNTASLKARRKFYDEMKVGLQCFTQSKFLVFILIAALICNFGFVPLDIVLTAWIKGTLHESSIDFALVNAGLFIGMIVGGLTLGHSTRKAPLRKIFLVGMLLCGVCVSCMGIVRSEWWCTSLAIIIGFASATINGAFESAITTAIPTEVRGRVFGTISALFTMAMPLGLCVASLLLTRLPLVDMFYWMGGLSLFAAILFMLPIVNDLQNIVLTTIPTSSVD